MRLKCIANAKSFDFVQVGLVFSGQPETELFALKNNKSVGETLAHKRYSKLADQIIKQYPESIGQDLGKFLANLKSKKDTFYLRFLNKYGDDSYSVFRIADEYILDKHGVYCYTQGNELKYIGRCRDSMKKRINQGYGKISPKNCYLDGQATNCHLNALISKTGKQIKLWFCELEIENIIPAEKCLLSEYRTPWNIQRG